MFCIPVSKKSQLVCIWYHIKEHNHNVNASYYECYSKYELVFNIRNNRKFMQYFHLIWSKSVVGVDKCHHSLFFVRINGWWMNIRKWKKNSKHISKWQPYCKISTNHKESHTIACNSINWLSKWGTCIRMSYKALLLFRWMTRHVWSCMSFDNLLWWRNARWNYHIIK